MTNHTKEDRAYMSAAVEAGCWIDREGDKYDAQRLESRGIRWWAQANTPFSALAAAGRAMGLHAEAKAILEEMAGPVPVVDIHGRVLAAEGYVLVPRDVAEKAVLYQLALHSWMDEGSEGMAVSPSEVLANYVALANALGGKKEGTP